MFEFDSNWVRCGRRSGALAHQLGDQCVSAWLLVVFSVNAGVPYTDPSQTSERR
jgi:hypothetical protein